MFSLVSIDCWPGATHLQEKSDFIFPVSFHQVAADSSWLSPFLGSFFPELRGQIYVHSRTLSVWNLPEIRCNMVDCMTVQIIKGISTTFVGTTTSCPSPATARLTELALVSACPWTGSWRILQLEFISNPAGHAMRQGSIAPGAAPSSPLHGLLLRTGEPEPKWCRRNFLNWGLFSTGLCAHLLHSYVTKFKIPLNELGCSNHLSALCLMEIAGCQYLASLQVVQNKVLLSWVWQKQFPGRLLCLSWSTGM